MYNAISLIMLPSFVSLVYITNERKECGANVLSAAEVNSVEYDVQVILPKTDLNISDLYSS